MEESLQEESNACAQNRAVLALAWQLGPRVHEISGLTMKDIALTDGTATGYFVRIIGKGNKECPVTPQAGGQCRPPSQGLAGGPRRDARGAFLLHFLPRQSK